MAEGLDDEDRKRVRDAEDEVLDHLDRTGYRTFSDRALAVQNHLPLFLRAIEEKLVRGDVGRTRRVVIDHAALPHGAFQLALLYQPRPGNVVICDFAGYVVPEMIKVRPVVVIARNRKNGQLVTVVPLSTTAPTTLEDHHHELATNPLPGKPGVRCWAKCDMLATVSLARLDRVKGPKRQFVVPVLPAADFEAIRRAVAKALDLTHILGVP